MTCWILQLRHQFGANVEEAKHLSVQHFEIQKIALGSQLIQLHLELFVISGVKAAEKERNKGDLREQLRA